MDVEQSKAVFYQGRWVSGSTYTTMSKVLIHFDAKGKVDKEVIVPTKIASSSLAGISHLLIAHDEGAFMIYNDNTKNIGKQIQESKDISAVVTPGSRGIPMSSINPSAVMCSIDYSGTKKFNYLFNFKDLDVYLDTNDFLSIAPGTFILAGSYQNNSRLFKLEFKD